MVKKKKSQKKKQNRRTKRRRRLNGLGGKAKTGKEPRGETAAERLGKVERGYLRSQNIKKQVIRERERSLEVRLSLLGFLKSR